jgi:hypothetical protein
VHCCHLAPAAEPYGRHGCCRHRTHTLCVCCWLVHGTLCCLPMGGVHPDDAHHLPNIVDAAMLLL